MPYVIGIVLSLGVALLARGVGFDRDRAFYPTVLIVIASYYGLPRQHPRNQGCPFAGRPFVWRMTSEQQAALPGS